MQKKSEEAVKPKEVEHSRKESKHAVKATGIELFLKEPPMKVTGWETDLERQTQQKVYLDRHVLYEPAFRDGPYLINCVRPLDGKPLQHTVEKANNVWIYNHRPCIDTYTYGLSALAFMLGMKLDVNSPSDTIVGYGAFGMSLTCQQREEYGQLNLAYSSGSGDILEKPINAV